MSGHSKWHSIKHKKAQVDAKRGKIFTRLIRELTVAARTGGGDPEGNARLRTAIMTAKASNMPGDNIERAIKKGTGELPGTTYEEVSYEGYGPGGVAIIIEAMTDNKNRTISDMRYTFTRHNGNLGEVGCVTWIFKKKGFIVVDQGQISEDKLFEIVIEAGAQDLKQEGETFEITTELQDFEAVLQTLKKNEINPSLAEITMIPSTTVKLEGKKAEQMLKLMEKLEENDDIQNVWANFDIDEKIMEEVTV